MPFENHGNRSFTAISIAKNAPPASGVYGLVDACRWIYIGETADIQAELLRHVHNPPAFLREYSPSEFTYDLSTAGHRIDWQNQLAFELEPYATGGLGPFRKWTSHEEEHRSGNH